MKVRKLTQPVFHHPHQHVVSVFSPKKQTILMGRSQQLQNNRQQVRYLQHLIPSEKCVEDVCVQQAVRVTIVSHFVVEIQFIQQVCSKIREGKTFMIVNRYSLIKLKVVPLGTMQQVK